MPISYADALPLLRATGRAGRAGGVARRASDHLSPRAGPAKVHLKLQFDWKLAPAYNVIARMRGAELPDQWIIRGNHHDAWVNGANDPISGMVAVMEEARAIGELAKTGWKPKRTLIFAGWDAEEPGLLGSTEWVEHHADELRRARRGLHQLRLERPRILGRRRLAHARALHQRGRARRARSAVSRTVRAGTRAGARDRARLGRRRERGADARGPAHRRARLGLRLHAVPPAPRHRLAQHRLRRRGRGRLVSLDLRLDRSLQPLRRSRLSSTASRWRRPAAAPMLRLANADVLPFQFAALRKRSIAI